MTTHSMGNGFYSPCGLEPASVYHGFEGAFTTEWADVDCATCLASRIDAYRIDVRPSLLPFYVTFGVQYRYQDHPYWEGADPSGWVTIMAPSYDKAMALAHAYFGDRYAFIYPADKFDTTADRKWYPKGELAVLTLGDLTIEGDGPKPIVTTSESWLYGVGDNAIVAARLVGRLKGVESDSHEKLGYDVEVVHLHCLDGAIELFAVVENIDRHVHAFELDWAVPNECPVCDISIT